MTLKSQTSRRGLAVSAAVAVAAVLVAVGTTAAMQSDEKKDGATVEQSAPQGEAPAATSPTFLAAADLPAIAEAGVWQEQDVQAGLPDPEYACIKGLLPVSGTSYKSFTGDMTAEAREFVTVAKDAAAAESLVASLGEAIAKCGDAVEGDSSFKRYGAYPDVANGLTVYGTFFAPENSEYHLQLFGVGRDGSSVVVTTLGQQGQESEAPVEAFTATAKTALEKAF